MANLKSKNIDLLRAYQHQGTKHTTFPVWAKMGLLPLAMAVLFTSIFVYGTIEANHYQNKLKDTKAEIAALEANGTSQEVVEYQNVIEKNKSIVSNLSKVVENMETYPRFQKNMMDNILIACGNTVLIKDLSFNEIYGRIELTLQTPYVYETSDFITRLKNRGIFADVYYTGYNSTSPFTKTDSETSETKTDSETSESTDKETSEEPVVTVKVVNNSVYETNITCVLKVGD